MRLVRTSLAFITMAVLATCANPDGWKTRLPAEKDEVTKAGLIEVVPLGIDPFARVPKARVTASFTTTTVSKGDVPDCVETTEGKCTTTYCELPLPDAGARDSGVVHDSVGQIDFAAVTFDGGLVFGGVMTTSRTAEFYLSRAAGELDLWVVSTAGSDAVPPIDKQPLFATAPLTQLNTFCDGGIDCGELRLDSDVTFGWLDGGTGQVTVTLATRTERERFTETISVACEYVAPEHEGVVPKSALRHFTATDGTLVVESGRTTGFSAGDYKVKFRARVPERSGKVKFTGQQPP